jgi:hypothetical protein
VNDVAIDERVRALVDAHREEIAGLIREAIDRELQVLVDVELDVVLARLAELRANGAARVVASAEPTTAGADDTTPARPELRGAAKLCARCGERPRLADRTLCRRCKTAGDVDRRRQRRREQHDPAVVDAEPPRTA